MSSSEYDLLDEQSKRVYLEWILPGKKEKALQRRSRSIRSTRSTNDQARKEKGFAPRGFARRTTLIRQRSLALLAEPNSFHFPGDSSTYAGLKVRQGKRKRKIVEAGAKQ